MTMCYKFRLMLDSVPAHSGMELKKCWKFACTGICYLHSQQLDSQTRYQSSSPQELKSNTTLTAKLGMEVQTHKNSKNEQYKSQVRIPSHSLRLHSRRRRGGDRPSTRAFRFNSIGHDQCRKRELTFVTGRLLFQSALHQHMIISVMKVYTVLEKYHLTHRWVG